MCHKVHLILPMFSVILRIQFLRQFFTAKDLLKIEGILWDKKKRVKELASLLASRKAWQEIIVMNKQICSLSPFPFLLILNVYVI